MNKYLYTFAILGLFSNIGCQTVAEAPTKKEYPRMIGDIGYDAKMDTTDFQLCNDEKFAVQYYAYTSTFNEVTYHQGKYETHKIFAANYTSIDLPSESGLVRVRFLVNCRGETGRFRVMGMDKNYQPKAFPVAITNQLITIIKNYLEWNPFKTAQSARDYYQYLIFKIDKGQIIDILP